MVSRSIAVPTKALFAAAIVSAFASMAMAATESFESDGPNCGVTRDYPELRSVWLGHFSGGRLQRIYDHDRGVDWQDRYRCFQSRASCQRWQRQLRAVYRKVEGYRTCIVIRSGPLGTAPLNGPITAAY